MTASICAMVNDQHDEPDEDLIDDGLPFHRCGADSFALRNRNTMAPRIR